MTRPAARRAAQCGQVSQNARAKFVYLQDGGRGRGRGEGLSAFVYAWVGGLVQDRGSAGLWSGSVLFEHLCGDYRPYRLWIAMYMAHHRDDGGESEAVHEAEFEAPRLAGCDVPQKLLQDRLRAHVAIRERPCGR